METKDNTRKTIGMKTSAPTCVRRNKKMLFALLLSASLALTLFSCEKDKDYYSLGDVWISMGFIEQANEGLFSIRLDNGDTLVPVSNAVPYFKTENNQRIMVNYTILDEVNQSTKKFYVKVNNLYEILYKDIIELTEQNNDSIGNDPVHIIDIWKSGSILNVEFSFLGGGITHYINLAKPAGNPNGQSEPIELELRHNARKDPFQYQLRSIVSFDLNSIEIAGRDSIQFKVISTDYGGNKHTFSSTYKY